MWTVLEMPSENKMVPSCKNLIVSTHLTEERKDEKEKEWRAQPTTTPGNEWRKSGNETWVISGTMGLIAKEVLWSLLVHRIFVAALAWGRRDKRNTEGEFITYIEAFAHEPSKTTKWLATRIQKNRLGLGESVVCPLQFGVRYSLACKGFTPATLNRITYGNNRQTPLNYSNPGCI